VEDAQGWGKGLETRSAEFLFLSRSAGKPT
jgi:hypothetical protein